MNNLLPNTTTATQLQRNYKSVIKKAKKTKKPLTVLSNNKPELVIMDYATFEKLSQAQSPVKKAVDKKTIDTLFGIWSKEEAEEFEKNTKAFEQIDENMWHT